MTTTPVIQNTMIKLADLAPHPSNYRTHPESQIQDLMASLLRFGQVKSIVIQEGPHPLCVAGHGIVEAARRLNYSELRADVIPADWSPADVKGYLIADNQHAANALDDEAILASLLQEQHGLGLDLAALGTDEETLRQMLESLGDEYLQGDENTQEEDEKFPLEELPSRAKVGDMWELGRHRLLVGDSTNPEHVYRLMGEQTADACLTDPPYNVGIDYGKHKDKLSLVELEVFIREWFSNVHATVTVVTPGFGYNMQTLLAWLRLFPPVWIGVWIHNNGMSHTPLRGFSAWEPLLIWGKPANPIGQDIFDFPVSIQKDVVDEHGNKLHPTPKPVKLWSELIEKFTKENDLIYEPFCGSGTTLVAAERTDRRCYAIELEPKYVDLILHRYEAETGGTASLLTRLEVSV